VSSGGWSDPDVQRLLGTPAHVGGKEIWVCEACVRRLLGRRRTGQPGWQLELQLRQLLETGTYRRSPPSWLPEEIAAFDGYVELRGGAELVGLVQDRTDRRSFRAVTWFERACLDWKVLRAGDAPRSGAVRIELSTHAVKRYRERIVRGDSAGHDELARILPLGRLLPEAPPWWRECRSGEIPAYWVVIDDWLVLPLQPSTRPAPDVFLAVTCLYRGMQEDEGLGGRQAELRDERLRLQREGLLRLADAQDLRDAA
jgi:hypothetical protein